MTLITPQDVHRAYHLMHEKKGSLVYDQPRWLVEFDENYAYLTNIRGILAKYNLKTKRFVKFKDPK